MTTRTTRTARSGVLRVFSCDPGSKNFGFAIVEGVKKGPSKIKIRVVINGLCPCPLNNLKDHRVRRQQRDKFLLWANRVVKKYKPHGIFAERYMTRGIKGPTIESVNMMIGMLQSLQMADRYVPASVWKNAFSRSDIDLKEEYKLCKTAPHQLDAVLIGTWGIFQAFGMKDLGATTYKEFVRIVQQTEETSRGKLYKRKATR